MSTTFKPRPRNWWTVIAEDHHTDIREEGNRLLATTRWKQGDPLPVSVNRMGMEIIGRVADRHQGESWSARVTLMRDGGVVLVTTAGHSL